MPVEQVDAGRAKLQMKDALALLEGVRTLHVAKGKKLTTVDLKQERPDQARLASLMLGPTGNLRAPTVRRGHTLVVGFNQDIYTDVFGSRPLSDRS